MLVIMVFMTDIPTFARDSRDLEQTEIESTEETQVAEKPENSTQEEAYIVSEVKEKRESNMKHFRMSNGNITAAVYPFDVHYEDDDFYSKRMENNINKIQMLKEGKIEPINCGKCDYCADTLPCEVISMDELLLEV